MTNEPIDPGFAPADPTDGRDYGDWKTRYSDPLAQKKIRFEAIYLFIHLALVIIVVFFVTLCSDRTALEAASGRPKLEADGLPGIKSKKPEPAEAGSFSQSLHWQQLLHAFLGGVLGGTLLSIKWLYHVVAKNLWNIDRRLWRLFTPYLSGALALAFVVLMGSGLIVVFDQKSLGSVWVCFGLSFLVGYFSDTATAKLSEVARTLFGTTKSPRRPRRSGKAQGQSQ
jgi:hypothetical protein